MIEAATPPTGAVEVSSAARPRLDALDGLRTLLVVFVMISHLEFTLGWGPSWAVGAWVMVDGFFVLSGLLITTNLVREIDSTGTIALARFFARRLARLVPALAVMLAAAAIVAMLADGRSWHDTWPSLVSSATYLHNFAYVYGWYDDLLPEVGLLWSLSIEFQFYVVAPFVFLAVRQLHIPRRWLRAALLAAVVASCIARARLGVDDFPRPYLFTPMRIDALIWGVLIALSSTALTRVPRWLVQILGLSGVCAAAWLYVRLDPYTEGPYDWGITLAGVSFAAVVVWLLRSPNSLFAKVLSMPPVVALGRRSYGAYIWHQLVVVFLHNHTHLALGPAFALSFVATWMIADVSYRFVERPILRRASRPAPAV